MFYRVRHDKSGWEPRRLFNVVEFMMHDKDMSGTIDMDECMEILFRRFGKEQLEAKVAEFMQNDEDGDNDILHRVPRDGPPRALQEPRARRGRRAQGVEVVDAGEVSRRNRRS